jgi:hypothetical protein
MDRVGDKRGGVPYHPENEFDYRQDEVSDSSDDSRPKATLDIPLVFHTSYIITIPFSFELRKGFTDSQRRF